MKQSQFKSLRRKSAYGGSLLNTRKGRSYGRPLGVRSSMHLVLRSSKAVGNWSFRKGDNSKKVRRIIRKFSEKYSVRVLMWANVGNHIHLHIKLPNRQAYKPFIRAITSAIAMAITGASRWRPLSTLCEGKFWDQRPFTRIVQGLRDALNLRNYIELNQLEGCGMTRSQASYVLAREWDLAQQRE